MDNHELQLFRDSAQRLLRNEVLPHYDSWERAGITPRSLWNLLGDNGLLCVDLPPELGGSGVPLAYSQTVIEEVGQLGMAALATNMVVHSDIVAHYLLHYGNAAQQQQWLPKMASGAAVGAIAMTEPGAGSDLQGMRTSAVRNDAGWLINGSKTFITNGQHADLVIVAAKSDPKQGGKGISLFLVDTTLPGFERGRNLEKIGLHSGDTSELFFNDLQIGADALLGELNQGFVYMMQQLPRERLGVATAAIAAAEGALQWTCDYVKERQAFGKPISAQQNTRFKLAEAKTRIELNKALLQQCIARYEDGKLDVATAAMLKLSSTEMQGKVIDECLQLFGGYGYMLEYPISRAYVDARVQRIYAGTSEIMKEIIARDLLGR